MTDIYREWTQRRPRALNIVLRRFQDRCQECRPRKLHSWLILKQEKLLQQWVKCNLSHKLCYKLACSVTVVLGSKLITRHCRFLVLQQSLKTHIMCYNTQCRKEIQTCPLFYIGWRPLIFSELCSITSSRSHKCPEGLWRLL
jgi:hypothetical protein